MAICSIWRLFSAFCVIDALICSSDDVVSCTEAACSLVPCESVWAEADTWLEADDTWPTTATTWPDVWARASAPERTSSTTPRRRSAIRAMAASSWPTSSRPVAGTFTKRSPREIASVTRTAWRIGRVTPRASWTESAAPATIVRSMTATIARAVHLFWAARTSALSFIRLKFAAARSAVDFSSRSIASL